MNTLSRSFVLLHLWLAALLPCGAMISVGDLSPAQARALGVTVRTTPNGEAGVRVWLEFESKGKLAKITYVEVEIGDRENRVMSAQLRVTEPAPGTKSASFSAFPAYLPRSSFMIVVYGGPDGDVGYRIRVKDFIELPVAR